jgi:heterotetrameric sarcosine oxidase delta subunit
MAFRLFCPNCGSRPYTEFSFGGETHPPDPELSYQQAWWPDNVAGTQTERWFHQAGCRRWMTVRRNTVTNDIDAVD